MAWTPPIQLFVPRCGTLLRLKKAWTFKLHNEGRNESLFEALGLPYEQNPWKNPVEPIPCGLPIGTVLKVDRVYIRQGCKGPSSDFDSMSFQIMSCPKEGVSKKHGFGKTRFWVKMEDANFIVAEVDDERKPAEHKPNPNATADLKPGDVVTRDYWSIQTLDEGLYITHKLADVPILIIGKQGERWIGLNLRDYSNNFMDLPAIPIYLVQRHEDDVQTAILKWVQKQTKYRWSMFQGRSDAKQLEWATKAAQAHKMTQEQRYLHASCMGR